MRRRLAFWIVVSLALSNTDTGNAVYDTMTNIKTMSTENWPVVRLDL